MYTKQLQLGSLGFEASNLTSILDSVSKVTTSAAAVVTAVKSRPITNQPTQVSPLQQWQQATPTNTPAVVAPAVDYKKYGLIALGVLAAGIAAKKFLL